MNFFGLVRGANLPLGDMLSALPDDVLAQRARQRSHLIWGATVYLLVAAMILFV